MFIDDLDISGLGFKAEAAETGRPGYHPRTMLKIYVYGYLNQVHSSLRHQQLSLTDPDAKSMKYRCGGMGGYNVQTAVGVDTYLIVSQEVSNVGTDRRHLTRMARHDKTTLQVDHIQVLADRGYYKGGELRSCEDHNIATYVPNSTTSSNKAKGQFDPALLVICLYPLFTQTQMHHWKVSTRNPMGA